MMNEKDQHLVLAALKATDAYLGIIKDAKKQGAASGIHIHDFTQHYTNAHAALSALNMADQHEPYMKNHVGEMIKLSSDEDTSLADEPYAHAPKGAGGDVDEDYGGERSYINTSDTVINPRTGRAQRAGKIYFYTKTDPEQELAKVKRKREIEKNRQMAAGTDQQVTEILNLLKEKSLVSGISIDVLTEVYSRALDIDSDPIVELNSYVMRGKTYQLYSDLHEFDSKITDNDIEIMLNNLSDEEIEEEETEELDEGISATTRLKKGQHLRRRSPTLDIQKSVKMSRTADINTLKNRARVAARRAIMKRLLKGRQKHQLSPQEKDRIEQQVRNMKSMVDTMATKMLPRVRELQTKRLSSRGKKK